MGGGGVLNYRTLMCGLGDHRKATKLSHLNNKVDGKLLWQIWAWIFLSNCIIVFTFHLLHKTKTWNKFMSCLKALYEGSEMHMTYYPIFMPR
jgi:hypothetical protein